MRTSLPCTQAPTLRGPSSREVARRCPDRGRPRPRGVPGPSGRAQTGAGQAPSSAAPPRGVARVPRARRERRGGGARAWAARSRAEPSGAAASAPAGPRAAEPGARERAPSAGPARPPEGRARVRVHPPAADPALPRALPPPAARCRRPSTLRPGVSAHPGGAAPACPRGLSPSRRACQARPRSGARYLGRSEMAWPRGARGAQTPQGWRESGPGVWCVPEVLSPHGAGEVVEGRAQTARALRTWGPRQPPSPRGGHGHDTVAGGAERSQTRKCPKFSSEHFAGLNFEM